MSKITLPVSTILPEYNMLIEFQYNGKKRVIVKTASDETYIEGHEITLDNLPLVPPRNFNIEMWSVGDFKKFRRDRIEGNMYVAEIG